MAEAAPSSNEESMYLADLPSVTWWRDSPNLRLFQWRGFWLLSGIIKAVSAIENQFKPLPTDILLASFPKSGTTWLKALTVSILSSSSSTHNNYSKQEEDDPLRTHNPHELVPFLELEIFGENPTRDVNSQFPSPRVFNTHLPYSILPEKVRNSGCRIIYISRSPADTFVSAWHFFNKSFGTIPLEEAFDDFINGVVFAGPYFDHVLDYWKEREWQNVFFVTYEELNEDPNKHVKRLAEFLGCPLNSDEIEKVVWKSSIERLRNSDVNTDESRVHWSGAKFSSYFRKGVVGDGKSHLTSEMMERLRLVANQEWEGSGLEFKA